MFTTQGISIASEGTESPQFNKVDHQVQISSLSCEALGHLSWMQRLRHEKSGMGKATRDLSEFENTESTTLLLAQKLLSSGVTLTGLEAQPTL